VILPGAAALPRPAPVEAPRGFFEAARPAAAPPDAPAVSVTGAAPPPSSDAPGAGAVPDLGVSPGRRGAGTNDDYREVTADPEPAAATERVIPAAASAKLEQLKDLYLTAEAIGEDALDKHFDQVSERQRQLIREFFDRSGPSAGSVS
jgi:hypothetical protein